VAGKLHVIEPSGIETTLRYRGREPDLKVLQDLVGGYIEPVAVKVGDRILQAYCNEEGLVRKLPYNPKASALFAARHNAPVIMTKLYGTVVIVEPAPRRTKTPIVPETAQ
jgi:hypothetical protein